MTRAKLYFHLALAGVFVPVIGVPVAATLGLIAAQDRTVPEAERAVHRRWTRGIFALVALDVALLSAFLFLVGPLTAAGGAGLGAQAPAPVIGVQLEPGTSPPRVAEVMEASPAARAGLRAGDEVLSVDGAPVDSVAALQSKVRACAPGCSLRFELARGRDTLTVEVSPGLPGEVLAPSSPRGLFEPAPGRTCSPAGMARRGGLFPLLAAAVVLALWAAGRRKGMDATVVQAALVLVAVGAGAAAAAWGVCELSGGPTRGGFLVGLTAQTGLLLAGGGLLWMRVRRRPWFAATAMPAAPWLRTAAFGGWYMLTGGMRAGLAALVLAKLAPGDTAAGSPFADSPIHLLGNEPLGPLGVALLVLPVVVLGPAAEELLFRGVVLPWLAAWTPKAVALLVSGGLFAVLHLHYGWFALVLLWYGVVLGWARLHGGGLKAPILLHTAVNGLATAVLLWRGA